jgi:hypothetical protein
MSHKSTLSESCELQSVLRFATDPTIVGNMALVVASVAFESNHDGGTHTRCTIGCFVDVRQSVRTMVTVVRDAAWSAHAQPYGIPHDRMTFGRATGCRIRSPTHAWPLYARNKTMPLLPLKTALSSSLVYSILEMAPVALINAPLSYDSAYAEGSDDARFDSSLRTDASRLGMCEIGASAAVAEYEQCSHVSRRCAKPLRAAARRIAPYCKCGQTMVHDNVCPEAVDDDAAGTAAHRAGCACGTHSYIRRNVRYLIRLDFVPPAIDYTYCLFGDEVLTTRSALVQRYLAQLVTAPNIGLYLMYEYASYESRLPQRVSKGRVAEPYERPASLMHPRYNKLLEMARAHAGYADAPTISAVVVRMGLACFVDAATRALDWLPALAAVHVRQSLSALAVTNTLMRQMADAHDGVVIDAQIEKNILAEFEWSDNRRTVLGRVSGAAMAAPRTQSEHFKNSMYLLMVVCVLELVDRVVTIDANRRADEQRAAEASLMALGKVESQQQLQKPKKKQQRTSAKKRGRTAKQAEPAPQQQETRGVKSPVGRRYEQQSEKKSNAGSEPSEEACTELLCARLGRLRAQRVAERDAKWIGGATTSVLTWSRLCFIQ